MFQLHRKKGIQLIFVFMLLCHFSYAQQRLSLEEVAQAIELKLNGPVIFETYYYDEEYNSSYLSGDTARAIKTSFTIDLENRQFKYSEFGKDYLIPIDGINLLNTGSGIQGKGSWPNPSLKWTEYIVIFMCKNSRECISNLSNDSKSQNISILIPSAENDDISKFYKEINKLFSILNSLLY